MNEIIKKNIKLNLHGALSYLNKFTQCALLNYPNHPNIGDHLIWLGEILYLIHIADIKINYSADINNFSDILLKEKAGNDPIFLHGGGNLGDLWCNHQKFREYIISQYTDRPIVILPQTIYFIDKNNLQTSANIFNQHPDLTIFVRDNYSYEIANTYFYECRVIKSPDMAFQMIDMPFLNEINPKKEKKQSILYLCRKDEEFNQMTTYDNFNLSNLVVEDWVSFEYFQKYKRSLGANIFQELRKYPKRKVIKDTIMQFQDGFKQGNIISYHWIRKQKWNHFHPYIYNIKKLDDYQMHLRSWNLMYYGMCQLIQHRLVITNRLHVHILCILLGIPHIFLPNSYYKNEAFYKTWTYEIPFCKFIDDTSKVKLAAEEFIESW